MNTRFRFTLHLALLGMLVLLPGLSSAAEQPPALEENFDALNEGLISEQNSWRCLAWGDTSVVQSSVTPDNVGKALELKYASSPLSKDITPKALSGLVAVDFKLKLPDQVEGKHGKLILMLTSDAGDVVTTFLHDADGRWGLQVEDSYVFQPDTDAREGWRTMRVLVNFKEKSVSVFEGDGQDWVPVLADMSFVTPEAGNIQTVTFQNHPDGANASIFVDGVVVRPNP